MMYQLYSGHEDTVTLRPATGSLDELPADARPPGGTAQSRACPRDGALRRRLRDPGTPGRGSGRVRAGARAALWTRVGEEPAFPPAATDGAARSGDTGGVRRGQSRRGGAGYRRGASTGG